MKDRRKAIIIGTGSVGASSAFAMTIRQSVDEIVLIDKDPARVQGEAEDILHGLPAMGNTDIRAGEYEDIKDADVIIIAAGRNRKPGQNRLDLAKDNVEILRDVVACMKPYYNGCVVIVVANPVDVMTLKACEWLDKKDGTVFGTGCLLDTSRFVRTIADYVGCDISDVNAYIAGEHGDSQVAIWSDAKVMNVPIDEYCAKHQIEWNDDIKKNLAEKTKKMGAHIIQNKGRTHYGIALSVCYLVESIMQNKPIEASVSTPFNGEYGVSGVAFSMPSRIDRYGAKKMTGVTWTREETEKFLASAEALHHTLESIEQ